MQDDTLHRCADRYVFEAMMYTVKQAAEVVGKTKPTILRAIQHGRISARRDGQGRWWIEPAELRRAYQPTIRRSDTRIDASADTSTTTDTSTAIELLRDILDELRQLKAFLTDQPTPAEASPEPAATAPTAAVEADAPQRSEGASAVEAGVAHAAELASPAPQTPNGGQLAEPDTSLDRGDEPGFAERQARKATDRQALNPADLLIDRGKIAHMERRYGDAMQHFNDAAAVFQDGRPAQPAHALDGMAEAYYRQGFELRDNAALKRSIETWRSILQYCPRDRAPSDWARAQYNLGNVLARLGERENGTAHLTEAVAAYQAALQERTQERAPVDWTLTVGNQGVALMLLAERNGDEKRARIAIQQIETAL